MSVAAHADPAGAFWTWFGSGGFIVIIAVYLLFGDTIRAVIAAPFEAAAHALRERRKHQLKMRKIELEIARQLAEPISPQPLPGPCVHRKVTPVVSDGEVVSWLCRSCDTQLPPDWAVRKEDLQ